MLGELSCETVSSGSKFAELMSLICCAADATLSRFEQPPPLRMLDAVCKPFCTTAAVAGELGSALAALSADCRRLDAVVSELELS